MNSWRAGALLGSWLVSGGLTLSSCGSSGGAAISVAPMNDSTPVSPAATPGAGASGSGGEASSGGGAEPSPADEPSQQPGSEGVSGDVAIDTGSVDPASSGAPVSGADEGAPPEGSSGEPTAADPPAPLAPITLWIAGDSTVANGNTPCPRGWGGAFAPHFNDLVSVTNSAAGGRSVHTWLYEVQTVMDESGECALNRDASGQPLLQPRWRNMLDNMKAGDYLFIQFGINDGDRNCDRHVGIDAFTAAYGMMAEAAKARGAHPIFLTPVSMIACNGNTARGSRGEFVPATIAAGEAFDVPVIDLHARSVELFQSLGFCPVPGGDVSASTTGPVGDFFCDDHTHFSSSGAVEIANVVVQALIEQQIPLAAYLR